MCIEQVLGIELNFTRTLGDFVSNQILIILFISCVSLILASFKVNQKF